MCNTSRVALRNFVGACERVREIERGHIACNRSRQAFAFFFEQPSFSIYIYTKKKNPIVLALFIYFKGPGNASPRRTTRTRSREREKKMSDTRDQALVGASFRREQLEGLRNRLPSLQEQSENPKSKVAKYYSRQTRIVEQFQELENFIERTTYGKQPPSSPISDARSRDDDDDDDENLLQSDADFREQKRQETLALRTSFYVNVLLLAVKIFASVQSGSLSIITSALDSFLDLISGLILYFTDKHMQNMNKYLYPIGKSRMQPPILVFACIMGTLGFQVFIEGVQQLIGKEHTHHLEDLQLGDWDNDWSYRGEIFSVFVLSRE